jgi:hypothetical protein
MFIAFTASVQCFKQVDGRILIIVSLLKAVAAAWNSLTNEGAVFGKIIF